MHVGLLQKHLKHSLQQKHSLEESSRLPRLQGHSLKRYSLQ